ncbi:MAG: hypothetical protein QM673_11590 [Gordonia sp. (in: high G+C Gram-positive bacteria)]
MAVGTVNLVALIIFAAALCWRLDQIRRNRGGLQAVAMTIAIASLSLAFVAINHATARFLNRTLFAGSPRLMFYALLAIGVAALIVVFFFPGRQITRERRAGIEAIPLVAALIGLQVSLVAIPANLRTASIGEWTFKNWGFALFYLIASGYLVYGFSACMRSIWRFLQFAAGYLRVSLGLLVAGLGLLIVGSLVQIGAVLGSATGLIAATWTLSLSRVLDVCGVIAFLTGISFPMLHGRWRDWVTRRNRRRACAQLKPLWRLVTDAIPEVVLPTARLGPTARLHRMVVEIRDGVTQLSHLLPPEFEYESEPWKVQMLRSAIAEYRVVGAASGTVRAVLPAEGDGLDADAAPLLRVSRCVGNAGGVRGSSAHRPRFLRRRVSRHRASGT